MKENNLFTDTAIILGIALDNPNLIPADELRYDVGLILNENKKVNLPTRKIDDGKYAIFESHSYEARCIVFLGKYT